MADPRPSSHDGVAEAEEGKPSLLQSFSSKASLAHARVPYLSKLPFAAVAIIATLIIINLLTWAAVGTVLVC
jgi:high-affinity nickel-transport protein